MSAKVANELKKQLPKGSVFYDKDFTAPAGASLTSTPYFNVST